MSSYILLLALHVGTVFISIAGFFARGIWMMQSSPLLQRRWIKIVPHINDTLLLVSAIALVILTSQYPGPAAWINAKIIALVVIIRLASLHSTVETTMPVRVLACVGALVVYAYMVAVALSKSPLPI